MSNKDEHLIFKVLTNRSRKSSMPVNNFLYDFIDTVLQLLEYILYYPLSRETGNNEKGWATHVYSRVFFFIWKFFSKKAFLFIHNFVLNIFLSLSMPWTTESNINLSISTPITQTANKSDIHIGIETAKFAQEYTQILEIGFSNWNKLGFFPPLNNFHRYFTANADKPKGSNYH